MQNIRYWKLHITVVSCSDLPDTDGKSDHFVRVFLVPGTHKELKTRVVKGNLNPVFNEEFSFVVSSIKFCFHVLDKKYKMYSVAFTH